MNVSSKRVARHSFLPWIILVLGCSGSLGAEVDAATADGARPADAARGNDTGTTDPQPDAALPGADASVSPETDAGSIEPESDAGGAPVTRRFVAVGYGGHRTSSLDGRTWENHLVEDPDGGDDPRLLRGVGYGAGLFIAVGNRVMTSTDGVDWTTVIADTGSFLTDVEWADGMWVAAGGNGLRMRSTDGGATFTDRSPFVSGHFRGIAAGGGAFVAVGHTYDNAGLWSTTRDGVTWTDHTGGRAFSQIAFGAGVFVAVGDGGRVSVSTDGASWDESTLGTSRLADVSWAGGQFLTRNESGYWSSTDGRSWARHEGSIPDAIVFSDGLYVGATWTALRASEDPAGPWSVEATSPAITDIAVSTP